MSKPVFAPVPGELDFPKEEREILAFWKKNGIFEKSLAQTAGKPEFVFYEGPPTANGMPHNGHVLTRAMKDIFPRYKTMQGFHVARRAGWDTHGLPVEVEVEKELRIHGKAAIEAYGVEPFVKRCIDSVFRYQSEWEKLTDRIAFWVDLEQAYVTYHKRYVESVWWALSQLFEKGLLYQGHKVVWWWAQGGTALSSGEVGQGYKTVDDPSVYVAFPLKAAGDPLLDGASLLVWTTTPWTLPSNMYAAVGASYTYAVVELDGRKLVIAEKLVEGFAKKLKKDATILGTVDGSKLVGLGYTAPFDLYAGEARGPVHTVIAADFVTLDSGTGVVHIAPAFGEDDHEAHRKLLATHPDLPLFCAVKPDGTFVEELATYAGRWVKDCDKEIQAELKTRGILVFAEPYRHEYPFCWRADNDPLIQYARPAWYIRTTALNKEALANNAEVNWLPPHIKEGRFGDFLRNNVDWALSRERYWGTPLNVWVNDVSGKMEAPSCVDAILAKNPKAFDHFHAAKAADPTLSEHLIVHKPWIDAVTWENPGEPGVYRRVSEVIDCWFDSGCMPFAQHGFPHHNHDAFKASFPADFISEAIDQTRGWFYSLLMTSTLLFDEETRAKYGLSPVKAHPYKTCIVLGHVSDKEGKKESKGKGNYTPPDLVIDAVKMDFAVLAETDAVKAKPGTAFIAKEDLDGLDLLDGATVTLVGVDGAECVVTLATGKKLGRRVMVLAPAEQAALGVKVTGKPDVKPVEVPALPVTERVLLCDRATPAPGADAFRWFFYASNPPWNATRHSLSNVRSFQKETLVKLRNVYSFFTIYANIDGWDPKADTTRNADGTLNVATLTELDRWILGELTATIAGVTAGLDGFDPYTPTQRLTDFVDALSNWYVRRSRDRFWASAEDVEAAKNAAYGTLYTCLVTLAKLFAPFTPYLAEGIYQNLVGGSGVRGACESVHLASWPSVDQLPVRDEALAKRMAAVRALVGLGREVRTNAKTKTRQPLRRAHLVVADRALRAELANYATLVAEELNVLEIAFPGDDEAGTFVTYKLKPNFRTLGQKGMGKEAQTLKKAMAALDDAGAAQLLTTLQAAGSATLDGVPFDEADVEREFLTKEGFAAAGDRVGVVVLDARLDEELVREGVLREVKSAIQQVRKDRKLEFTARIALKIAVSDDALRGLFEARKEWLAGEVLASTLAVEASPTSDSGYERIEANGVELFVQIA